MRASEHIVTAFRTAAEAHADAIALHAEEGKVSYRELASSVGVLADALPHPTTERSVAAILVPHGADSLVGWLAALEAGYLACVIDPDSDPAAIGWRLDLAAPDVIITSAAAMSRDRQAAPGARVVVIDEAVRLSGSTDREPPRLDPERPAVLIFTSGTTGRPRGVMHGSAAMVHNATVNVADLDLTARDRALWTASLSTISGVSDALRILVHGGSLIPADLRAVSLQETCARIRTHEATLLHVVPTVFRRLMRVADRADLATVHLVHLGGEPITGSDVQLFREHFDPAARFVANLGSSEVPSFRRSIVGPGDSVDEALVPLRYSLGGKDTLLLDGNGERIDSAGAPGQIAVDTTFGALQYWEEADLTAELFRPLSDGRTRYLTGDLGEWTRDGALRHLGRLDRRRKVGGEWVDGSVVEAALGGSPGVSEAVAGWDDRDGALIASVTGESGLDASTLRQDLAAKLAPREIPRRIHIAASLPTLDNGKVDRPRALAAVSTERVETGRQPAATATESRLMVVWRDILPHGGAAGPESSFVDDGGDSLAALELRHRIASDLGIEVEPEIIFTAGTLRAIAAAIDSGPTHESTTHVQPSAGGTVGSPGIWCVGDHRPLVAIIDRLGDDAGVAHLRIDGLQTDERLGLDIGSQIAAYRAEAKLLGMPAPVGIVGFSYGGLLAYALAHALRSDGIDPSLLMIEPAVPGESGAVTRARVPWVGRVRRWVRSDDRRPDDRWSEHRPIMDANVDNYDAPSLDGGAWVAGRTRYVARTARVWSQLVSGLSIIEVEGSTHTSIAGGADAEPWLSVVEGWLERRG